MACKDPDLARLRRQLAAALSVPALGRDAGLVRELNAAIAATAAIYERQRKAILATCTALGIDEETRHQKIRTATAGRTSSLTETTQAERTRILNELAAAQGIRKPRPRGRDRVRAPVTLADTQRAIRMLLDAAGRGHEYADAIARERFGCDAWEWLDFDAAHRLHQMLEVDQRRRVARRARAAAE